MAQVHSLTRVNKGAIQPFFTLRLQGHLNVSEYKRTGGHWPFSSKMANQNIKQDTFKHTNSQSNSYRRDKMADPFRYSICTLCVLPFYCTEWCNCFHAAFSELRRIMLLFCVCV